MNPAIGRHKTVGAAALATIVALIFLAVVGTPVFADDPPVQDVKQDQVVSPLLRQFIEDRNAVASQPATPTVDQGLTRSSSGGGASVWETETIDVAQPETDTADDLVRFDSSGNVQVYIHLQDTNDSTLQQIRNLGATIEISNSDWNVVQAWVPISSLDRIGSLDAVQLIDPPDYGVPRIGSVNTQGDTGHRADLVRTFSGFTGAGVKVGVISDGATSWQSARRSKDLPSSIELDPDRDRFGHEGTALMEIIHDLAPGARLAFSGPSTSFEMVESILWLANDAFDGEGADIIVDDLGYYAQPYFEDGYVAEAAADAVAGGAVYVSAAGNDAEEHYEATFSDGGSGYHDFDSSSETDIALRIDLLAFTRVVLQWNDPFGESDNDYDLFVCPPGIKPLKFNIQNGICDSSIRTQDGDDLPLETVLYITHPLIRNQADVFIRKHSGSAKTLELFTLHADMREHGVPEGSIIGHPAVEEVLAVGAIDVADPGHDDPQDYSNWGPSVITGEDSRNKPDLMGFDGVSITGAGNFGRLNPGVRGNLFYGTSAAAPHVAGIAALVMEAQRIADPNATRKTVADDVAEKLKTTAVDLGDQNSDGYSKTFGYGRVDALSAMESIASGSDYVDLYSFSSSRFPRSYTVNSTGDETDVSRLDNECKDSNGKCTLRAAIQQANQANVTTGAVIKFNIPGSGTQTISPAFRFPSIQRPVFIDGLSQPNASADNILIEIDGTNAGADTDGLILYSQGSYVRGLAVVNFGGNGIALKGSKGEHVLVGNLIGTDAADATDHGNGAAGVYVEDVPRVILRDNVISGNTTYGVYISDSDAASAQLEGNLIGTNAAGTSDLGNTTAGVHIDDADSVRIRDNVISGNDSHGISIAGGAKNAVIERNRIGTSKDGTSDLGNTLTGIHISQGVNTTIAKNVISGNDSHGIELTGGNTYDADIAENHIGATTAGAALANGGSGIKIGDRSHRNVITDNNIANNGADGVTVVSDRALKNTIRRNAIHDNTGHGIDLGDDGATTNDTGDGDTGPNDLLNYPSDFTLATAGDVASVRLSLDVTNANQFYLVDFYECDSATSGEGKKWLGYVANYPDATGERTFTASTLRYNVHDFTSTDATHITATTTYRGTKSARGTNATSEFAPCVARTTLPALNISEDDIDVAEGGTATYTVALESLPSADVSIAVYSWNRSEATVSPPSLTFTDSNGTTAQTVTVTGVQDNDGYNEGTTISHDVVIGGNEYAVVLLPVEVDDDDPPVLTLTSTTSGVTFPSAADVAHGRVLDGEFAMEEGGTATYTVRLASEPPGDSTISLSSNSSDEFTVSPESIIFTKTGEAAAVNKYEWDAAQTVTLTSVQDAIDEDLSAWVSHEATVDGRDFDLAFLRANVTDAGLPDLAFTPASRTVSVDEGSTATYSIALSSDPGEGETATVAVNISSLLSVEGSITVSPSELTFTGGTSGNWATAQDVTVTGVADDDEFDDIARLNHTITTGGTVFIRPEVFVTVTDGNRAPYFGEGILTVRSVPENSPAATTVGDPVTAIDLNTSDTLTYSLEDDKRNEFEINANTGQITVATGATLDHEASPPIIRLVKVTVSDRTTDGLTDSIAVDIMVTDVNEPPVVAGDDTLTFSENGNIATRLARYTATDPEKGAITWSVSGTDGADFTIDSNGDLKFAAQPDYETQTSYNITVIATDDGDPVQAGELPVSVTITDVNEAPEIRGDSTIDDFTENGTGEVATYTATDPEGNTPITWSLAGADQGDFEIANGVLRFKNSPDYDRPADSGGNNHYEVMVRATDSTNKRGEVHVDVLVLDVDEEHSLSGPETVNDFPENSATSRQVGRYTVTDPEGATVTLSLSSGATDFNLASNGVVTFKESPDYEVRSSYTFTVRAVAGTHTVPKDVTVNIQNLEEPGSVSLSSVQPQQGVAFTATLTDDDGPSGTAWQWYRSTSRGSAGTAITTATSASYTPVAEDVGRYLRAVATYDDAHGNGKTVAAVSANLTVAVNPNNLRPEFASNTATRSIRENTRAGTNLGARFTATDDNGDRLTYSIPDSEYFEIVDSTGQLRTKAVLDHEDEDEHVITITATDPAGLPATVDVTITVEDVDETPVISGPATVEIAENGGTSVAIYTATDPDETGFDWELTGADSGDLTLSGGTLTLNEEPDYEAKNRYRVTIEAREQSPGTSVGRLSVTINVGNIDEPGMVEVPVRDPSVGQRLTATVVDPDGGVSSIEWKWERRSPGGEWTPIPGATSSSYTLRREDNGYDLRVVAIYRDRQGTGKTHTHEFGSPIALRPYFDSTTATRTIEENTVEGRNVGGRFTARHPDNASVTYSLGGTDAAHFTVDENGQLKTSDVLLDYETLTDHQAEVEITVTDGNNQDATITVTVTVTDECQTSGEPPCAPGRPSVRNDASNDGNLLVSWSAPRTPSGTTITGYELQYRQQGEDSWIPETVTGTDRSHTIESLTTGTTYEVQVRGSNSNGAGEWSPSGTGRPGVAPPPTPRVTGPATPVTPATGTGTGAGSPAAPATSGSTGGGGGGGGGGGSGGGGGFVAIAPAPPQAPRSVSSIQQAGQLFLPLTRGGNLGRVWRFIEGSQRWLFYDPDPALRSFNTLRTVNLASEPPAVVIVQVSRPQRFLGMPLYAGWNFVPVTSQPLTTRPGAGAQPVQELVRPLSDSGVLQRVWWLDSRSQRWLFYDPAPDLAAFNTLSTVDLAANPPVVLAISVSRRAEFRGRILYLGWNYVVMR